LSVVREPDQQRRARCEAWCEERDGTGYGEECCDEAVAVIMNTENREKQARDVSGTEWRSTDVQEKRTEWSGDEHFGPSTLSKPLKR